ncbi:MAG TPA: PASTA domain-containing protein [Streptosporangiaceae bacterium]|nr:PASTA domain-containing protein [Streptosporangiaceae bacterium]
MAAALAAIVTTGLAATPASASVPGPVGAVLSAYAWGANDSGQLGLGIFSPPVAMPTQISGLTNVQQVAEGQVFGAALLGDGTVDTWGYDGDGELGDGRIASDYRLNPAPVPGLTGVIQIAAGYQHVLALKSDGTVWAWGYNAFRELGDGTTTDRATPFQIPGLTGITQISASYYDSMARASDGSVWAWGHNGFGELGDGTTTNRATPVKLPGLSGVAQVSAGYEHGLAVKSDGTVWAWGNNALGQLGIGTTANHASPVQVPGLTGVTQVAAGQTHSLAVGPGGSVWAWGDDTASGLGDGATTEQKSPISIGLTGIIQIAAGVNQGAAVTSNGALYLWGKNIPTQGIDPGQGPIPGIFALPSNAQGSAEAVQVSLGVGGGLAVGISAATVPSVVGRVEAQATAAVSAAGLSVQVVRQNDPTCAFIGKVMRESPDAGTQVALGSEVTLTVGQKVPNLACQ